MHELDFYVLGTFLVGLAMSSVTAVVSWRIFKNSPEEAYVELNISPTQLKGIIDKAVYEEHHTLIMPTVIMNNNTKKTLQLAFVDQRLRLEATYQELEFGDDDDDYDYSEV